MAPNLQVIGLISGGKDSLYSLLHCLENGHTIVALANLHPLHNHQTKSDGANPEDYLNEDIDSYMYQTVGHGVIPLYEEALGIPLYRQEIRGIAKNRSKSYFHEADAKEIDETESLIPLLKKIIANHPGANAVSTGAILSDYQRTRVESVAVRLNLTSLSYLWQYPYLPPHNQMSLLEDMGAVGQEARIIKVASGGLDARHLWLDVADRKTQAMLLKDMSRMSVYGVLEGGAVLGEGGEYETLAIDGPPPLWKRRIEMEGDIVSIPGEGGTFVVGSRLGKTIAKDISSIVSSRIRVPERYDRLFSTVLDKVKHGNRTEFATNLNGIALCSQGEEIKLRTSAGDMELNDLVTMSNIRAACNPNTNTFEDETKLLAAHLISLLKEHGLVPDDIVMTTIVLRSMSDFAILNKTYGTLFSLPLPPARVTIACGDQFPITKSRVMLSITATKSRREGRQGLHVQSQSYWAPANIGPYSQAISVPFMPSPCLAENNRVVFVAGQIPLIPSTMELTTEPFIEQAALSLQHLWRIGQSMGVHWWTVGMNFITASSLQQAQERAIIAKKIWIAAHEHIDDHEQEDENFDIGDLSLRQPWISQSSQATKVNLAPLPDCSRIVTPETPLCITLQVEELPRMATIEWSCYGLKMGWTQLGNRITLITDSPNCWGHNYFDVVSGGGAFFGCTASPGGLSLMMSNLNYLADVCIVELYHSQRASSECLKDLKCLNAIHVPCKSIWTGEVELSVAYRVLGRAKAVGMHDVE